MIEPCPGLSREIGELYNAFKDNPGVTPVVLLDVLNEPQRVQARGFEVRASHLLAEFIGLWRTDENTRWAVYDYDMELLGGEVFRDKDACVETIEGYQQADNLMPVRFQRT
jgi:hypothetical protein